MTKKAGADKTAAKAKSSKTKTPKKGSAAKKGSSSKSKPSKKSAADKSAADKSAADKSAVSKRAAKQAADKSAAVSKQAPGKSAADKSAASKPATDKSAASKRTAGKSATSKRAANKSVHTSIDATLFTPLTEGERAEALRVLVEDPRLSTMANVGRYRVITVEPLAVKPPHGLSGRRLARLVVYDYAADRSVDGCVDLDTNRVTHLNVSRAQPMLAREEEAAAIAIALADERVKEQLSLGEEPRVAMHYWSQRGTSLSYSRRSAAVIFGRRDSTPSLVAVVDLLDNLVCEIVPATQW